MEPDWRDADLLEVLRSDPVIAGFLVFAVAVCIFALLHHAGLLH